MNKNMNFINDIILKYPNLDFSKFIYKDSKTRSTIICKNHGEFENSKRNLITSKSNPCPICKDNDKINNYINILEEKYNNIFIFNKNTIKDSKDMVEYKCKSCNNLNKTKLSKLLEFNKSRNDCPKCSKYNSSKIESTKEKFKKLESRFPHLDFSKFEYKSRINKSIIICKYHGEFIMSYMVLTNPSTIFACPKCKQENKVESLVLGNDIMKNRLIEKFPYLNFNKFKAINAKDKSIVICNKHGEFKRSYDSLISKKCNIGCPKCSSNSYSKAEKEIVKYIKSFYQGKLIENDRTIILNEYTNKYLELDIYLPDISLAIEFNGKYYHSDEMIYNRTYGIFKTANEYHNYKSKKCNDKNIKLIHIDEQEYIKDKYNILNNIKEIII